MCKILRSDLKYITLVELGCQLSCLQQTASVRGTASDPGGARPLHAEAQESAPRNLRSENHAGTAGKQGDTADPHRALRSTHNHYGTTEIQVPAHGFTVAGGRSGVKVSEAETLLGR